MEQNGGKHQWMNGHKLLPNKSEAMNDYVIVNYSVREKNETFFVSEYEERHRKKTRFRLYYVLRTVVSYLPLLPKILQILL